MRFADLGQNVGDARGPDEGRRGDVAAIDVGQDGRDEFGDAGDREATELALGEFGEVVVLDCLRLRSHPTHFNLDQAVENANRLKAKQTYFTHMAHDIEHDAVSKMLPDHIALAYDGVKITL